MTVACGCIRWRGTTTQTKEATACHPRGFPTRGYKGHAKGERCDAASYLRRCRRKRNVIMYHKADAVTEEELDGLIAYAKELGEQVDEWLANEHPLLL